MAEIAVAIGVGWVVSPVISMVISKTQSYIENRFFKNSGLESELENMKTTLREILSIMSTVEKQRTLDPNQMELVQEIKDAVYDTEDVMDEFEYRLLEEKSTKRSNKTVSQIASSSCCVIADFEFNYNFKNKVKEVIKRLDKAKGSANTLLSLINVSISNDIHPCEQENDFITSSTIIDDIIGRQSECKQLMDLLFNHVDKLPTVIPIVGQGGMGKTTVAQIVFNNHSVYDHFDHKLWLCVSDRFDKIRLTKEMVKDVCDRVFTADMSFDTLQNKLEQKLEGKKVLLVLDDVWYNKDDKEQYSYQKQWKEVLAPLMKAKAESKIILTTREAIVGRILGTIKSINLDGLNEVDSWSLFELCAFDDKNKGRLQHLEPIGKEIVNKLKGSPLAIKVVGMQLRENSDLKDWQQTLCDDMSDTSDIMNILHRSYKHLPEQLKRCFAFCSLFPKGFHLKRNRLIHMWIAHGFVRPNKRSLEDTGESYFKELLARSFIQVIKRGSRKKYYVMHEFMNDLACHVSKGECHRFQKSDSMINIGSIRHLSIITTHALDILMNIDDLHKLRTLIFLEDNFLNDRILIELLKKLKRIIVLDIEWQIPNLRNIYKCKHLRYLSFRMEHEISTLGDSIKNLGIGKLHQLNALFFRKTSVFRSATYCRTRPLRIPNWSMSSLTVLDVSKTMKVQVGNLTQIRRHLRGHACLHVKKQTGYKLDQLENMNNIKGSLEITGLQNATSREETIRAQLHKKEHITKLSLDWENSSSKIESNNYHEVLEALIPNSNLEKLDITGYPGATWPSWLESNLLSSIKSIGLSKCEGVKMLPALGQLPLLQNLRIEGLAAVRRIGLEFYGKGTFPSMKSLVLNELTSLDEWSFPCNVLVFPKLRTLGIINCPMFIGSELDRFSTLRYLKVEYYSLVPCDMKMKELFRRDSSLSGLTKLKIAGCKGLITLKGLHKLVSLRKLFINNCPDLVSLPEMKVFYSLEFLAIFDCPALNSLPKKGLPVSLQLLFIGGTVPNQALENQIRSKKGLDWDKVTAISGCDLYASLQSGPNRHKVTAISGCDLFTSLESGVELMYSAEDIFNSESFREDKPNFLLGYIIILVGCIFITVLDICKPITNKKEQQKGAGENKSHCKAK